MKYHGNRYLNTEQGGILPETLNNGAPLSILTPPLEIKYISGKLTNGFKLTFINCKRETTQTNYGSRDTFTYTKEFMFEGIKMQTQEYNQFNQLKRLGIYPDESLKMAGSRKAYWRLSKSMTLHQAIPNKRLAQWGLKDLIRLYEPRDI